MEEGELETKLRNVSNDLRYAIDTITSFQNLLGVKEELLIRTETIQARDKLGSIIMSLTNETEITSKQHKRLLDDAIELLAHVKSEVAWIIRTVGIKEESTLEKDLDTMIKKLYQLKFKE